MEVLGLSGVLGILVICCPLIAIVAIVGYLISVYNGLVKLRVLVDEAWSGIDVQLKRRYDLIPNLVETVKGYAKHEKKLFEKVTELRTSAMQAQSPEEKGKLENELTGTLKTLFAVAENYPELKANENFMKLQDELSVIEEEVQSSRRYYNGSVRDFNTKIQVFPNNLIAGMLGFKSREFFEAEEEAKKAVKVDFSDEDKTEEKK
ncbi:MAG: LemA family protein [Candidatus Dojkabacteria bacterium]|nr:LemA family protein [Candidatus Dojkabacteria bacterium]